MRTLLLIPFLFFLLACGNSNAKDKLPPYETVVKKFFSEYNHKSPDPYSFEIIVFAKKKDGWHTTVMDRKTGETTVSELFYPAGANKFSELKKFSKGSGPDKDELIDRYLNGDNEYNSYGYARCRYHGYKRWYADMVKDFGGSMPSEDTLLEGLGRAYAMYAFGFVNDADESEQKIDPSFKKMGLLEVPSAEQLAKFTEYIDKSIQCAEVLAKRNPNYQTIVGSAAFKVMDQRLVKYHVLSLGRQTEAAKKVIDDIHDYDTGYRRLGHQYLTDCPPNSIVIGFGDNDTYPLWYVQEKEGFRKDVTVLNYSLLGLPRYIDMIKQSGAVIFSSTPKHYGKENFFIYMYDPNAPRGESIAELILTIQQQAEKNAEYIRYSSRSISRDVDTTRLTWKDHPALAASMTFDISTMVYLNDLMVFDIINSNYETRPVCFTEAYGSFKKNLQRKGNIYRLMPIK